MYEIIKQAVVAHISGIAKYKPGTKEIEWEDENEKHITVESLGDEEYIVRYYHTNGNLQSETTYHEGKLHGVDKLYHYNGKLLYETPYHEGKLHGVEKWYYLDGNLHYSMPYHEGKQHGVEKWYLGNGGISKKVLWEHGVDQSA